MSEKVRLRLPCNASSPRRARHEILRFLDSFGYSDRADDIELVVSELVTNAVLHAGSEVEVKVGADLEHLQIEVSDFGPGLPLRQDITPEDDYGRGLNILQAVAESWGTTAESDRTTVWCKLSREPSGRC